MLNVIEFLKAANEHGKATGTNAFVVDFGGVQNIDDPTVARVLVDDFVHSASGSTELITRLGPNVLACLCADGKTAPVLTGIEHLNDVLGQQGLGAIRVDRYVLPRDVRALSERVGGIFGGSGVQRAVDGQRNRRDDLGLLLGAERMLRQADVSALVHHQAIYDFARPRRPVPIARELTVSLDFLAERLGIAIAGNDWLLDKATLILDRRMLFHLAQERRPHDEPYAINLRVATVLGPEFPGLIGRLSAHEHDTLIVELSNRDREADPASCEAAVRELDRLGVHVAFHAGGWDDILALATATPGSDSRLLDPVDFLKLSWDAADLGRSAAEIEAMKAAVDHFGDGRLILERAETAEAVEFALGLGLRLMQGFGVTRYVELRQAKERDRAAARARRGAATTAPDAEEGAPLRNRLRKFFKL